MTLEELQAEIEALKEEKESLVAKNKELLSEKRKIKAKYEDIDPEQFNKILDENESLKKSLEKLDKESKANIEKLSNDLSSKDKYLQKVLIEDGLTTSLLKNGTKKKRVEKIMTWKNYLLQLKK